MANPRRDFLKAAGAAGTGALAFPSVARAQQVHRWKAQSLWSAQELTFKIFQEFCERVKKLTGGRLEITPFSAGAVTGVFETLDAVSAGVLQAQSSWPGYWTGKEPGLAVISDFVFGYSHPWQHDAWFHYKGGLQMLQEAYGKFNLHVVGVGWWGVESIPSKKPIRSMADFKGVKFRSPQGMTAEILAKLGASVVVLPGGEVYSALDKGVVDAADWATISMNQRMGFHEVAKYPIYPGFHSMPIQDFAVNGAAWKALPDDIKVILDSAVREWAWDQVERVALDDIRVVAELRQKGGVTFVSWSDDELRKIRALAQATWDDWAKKSPLAKRAVDSQKGWLRELGLLG
ncbi:MAG: TRAP transporter substrate-binding protein [Candidatus Rokubacteria bacterium]|nr:TRAP transporter substrate-binding protein [Candidatus Rokubacteria bacterium]